jgi:hypothetical protein
MIRGCFSRRASAADRQGTAPMEDKKTPYLRDTAHRVRYHECPLCVPRLRRRSSTQAITFITTAKAKRPRSVPVRPFIYIYRRLAPLRR